MSGLKAYNSSISAWELLTSSSGAGSGTSGTVAALSDLRSLTGMSTGDSRYVRYHTNEAWGGGGDFERVTATAKSATVNATTDVVTSTAHGFYTGQGVRVYGTALPGGIANSTTTYYVQRLDADTFVLHTSYDAAIKQLWISHASSAPIAIDLTTNTITRPAHGFANTNTVRFLGTALPAPLAANTTYFIVGATTDTFQVALTSGGAAIDITTRGTNPYIYPAPVDLTSTGTAVTLNYSDDNGVWIIDSANPASGRWLRRIQNAVVVPQMWGAAGLDLTNGDSTSWAADAAAFRDMIRYANTRGFYSAIKMLIPGKWYVVNSPTAGYKVLNNTHMEGTIINGATIQELQGSGFPKTMFDLRNEGQSGKQGSQIVSNLGIVGSGGTNAIGIRVGNLYGITLRDLDVYNYQAGSAIQINHDIVRAFTEGTVIDGFRGDQNFKHIELVKGAGDVSFSDTRIYRSWLDLSTPPTTTKYGLYVGDGAVLYSSTLEFKILSQNENCVGVHLGTNSKTESTHHNIMHEGWPAQTNGAPNAGVMVEALSGASMSGHGQVVYGGPTGFISNSINSAATIQPELLFIEAELAAQQTVTTGFTIAIGPAGANTFPLTTSGAVTGVIMAAGLFNRQVIDLINRSSNTITFDVAGTSRVAGGNAAIVQGDRGLRLKWDANYGGAGVGRWVRIGI